MVSPVVAIKLSFWVLLADARSSEHRLVLTPQFTTGWLCMWSDNVNTLLCLETSFMAITTAILKLMGVDKIFVDPLCNFLRSDFSNSLENNYFKLMFFCLETKAKDHFVKECG